MERLNENEEVKDITAKESEAGKLAALNKTMHLREREKTQADAIAQKLLDTRPVIKRDVSFAGEREAARLMDEVRRHRENARSYERMANDWERQIRTKKVPNGRQYEVDVLRRKARNEEDEARRCQQAAQRELFRVKTYCTPIKSPLH